VIIVLNAEEHHPHIGVKRNKTEITSSVLKVQAQRVTEFGVQEAETEGTENSFEALNLGV